MKVFIKCPECYSNEISKNEELNEQQQECSCDWFKCLECGKNFKLDQASYEEMFL